MKRVKGEQCKGEKGKNRRAEEVEAGHRAIAQILLPYRILLFPSNHRCLISISTNVLKSTLVSYKITYIGSNNEETHPGAQYQRSKVERGTQVE